MPAQATRGNDQWYFTVTPLTINVVEGDPVTSPIVTIAAYPEISSVTPVFGLIQGGAVVTIKGARLGGPLAVALRRGQGPVRGDDQRHRA